MHPFLSSTPTLPAFGRALSPQSIFDADVCDLVKTPSKFDGQTVRFRGSLIFEFEGDVVDLAACNLPSGITSAYRGIAWQYGGDRIAAPAKLATRIEQLTSPILRDAQLEDFQSHARAFRARRPDGEQCHSYRECRYYDLVATFTGKFFAGWMQPGRTNVGGYGSRGCCHLFVIEEVSDVAASRTSVPDGNRKFACTSDSWQSDYPVASLSTAQDRVAANREFMADQIRTHGDENLVDVLRYNWYSLGLDGRLVFSSPDLLTTYTAQFPQVPRSERARHRTEAARAPITMNVSRERCQPLAKLADDR